MTPLKKLEDKITNQADIIKKLIEQNKGLKIANKELNVSIKTKRVNLYRAELYCDFLRKRIKQCFGEDGYFTVMATIDNPNGFDIENYHKVRKTKLIKQAQEEIQ